MQCPRCGHENASSRAYCQRCGTPLNGTEGTPVQVEYKEPPPPPLNGHKALPLQLPHPPMSPPPRLENDEVTSSLFSYPESIARPRIGIFSGILYFIGAIIVIIGLLGALTTPGSGTAIGLTGLLLALVVLILSIVFFVRLRRRTPTLRWWQRFVWIIGATLIALLALTLEAIVSPHGQLTQYFTAFVQLFYGLGLAAIAIW
jgi:hypothetical protein